MARGGLHEDPKVRARQLEGLERGRQTAIERRKAGLPSKRAEAEAAARIVDGGARARGSAPDPDPPADPPPPPTPRRKDRQRGEAATGARRRAERDDAPALPWYAPFYGVKRRG